MKTPPSEDLLCAADWVEACQGLDADRMAKVAEWLRAKADAITLSRLSPEARLSLGLDPAPPTSP